MRRVKDELEPITDDEFVLRRVHAMYFKTATAFEISPSAFEPRVKGKQPDANGISLFRLDCLENVQQVLCLMDPNKASQNGVVGLSVLSVKSLKAMQLSICPDRMEIPGHVVIPEMNSLDYANSLKATIRAAISSLSSSWSTRRVYDRCQMGTRGLGSSSTGHFSSQLLRS